MCFHPGCFFFFDTAAMSSSLEKRNASKSNRKNWDLPSGEEAGSIGAVCARRVDASQCLAVFHLQHSPLQRSGSLIPYCHRDT